MNIDKCFKEYLEEAIGAEKAAVALDRKSTRLNSSHM